MKSIIKIHLLALLTVVVIHNSMAQTLTVIYPNGGESFTSGQQINIQWSSISLTTATNVSIELVNTSNAYVATIVDPTPNDGAHGWVIPTSIPTGSYRIKLYRTGTGSPVDYSNNTFTITQPISTLTISSPNGGENYLINQNINIIWASTSMTSSENVSIELVNSSNVYVATIVDPTPNDGVHSWVIPTSIPTGSYKIKLYRTGTGLPVDYSNNTFTITQPIPTLTISSPNGGENYLTSQNINIIWTSTNVTSSENVSIELVNSSNIYVATIVDPTPNDGSHSWIIPTSIPIGSYKIKIYKTGVGTPIDYSDNTFIINQPTISLVLPNGNETFLKGQTIGIDWTSTNLLSSENVSIELINSGNTTQTVVDPTINDGNYSWLISSSIPDGNYKIKIYKTGTGIPVDLSDNYFSITSCNSPNPASFTVTNLTSTTARLNWGTVNGAVSYNINLVQGAQTYPASPTYSNVITNYIDVSGLSPNTIYKFQVQSNCVSGISSLWSGSIPNHFTTPPLSACGGCTQWANPPITGSEVCTATAYLCQQGFIIQTQDGNINATTSITRQDLAIMLYKTLFGGGGAYSDGFPITYLDLKDKTSPYYKAVLAMSYLQFSDHITPFNRDETFEPILPIARKYAIKVFLEAWNIPQDLNGPSPFADVLVTDEMYGYIKKAHSLGLIFGNGGLFSPNDNIVRDDAFLILHRLLQQSTYPRPVIGNADFFKPHNLTDENMRQNYGETLGGFKSYGEAAFAVNGFVPLHFGFHYDVTKTGTEYRPYLFKSWEPGAKYNFENMGKGWTHSYNAYLIKKNGPDNSAITDDRIYIRYPDGEFVAFKYLTPTTFEPETKMVYESLALSGVNFLLTFKNKTVLTFVYLAGNSGAAVLTKINDRFNNAINITWELVSNKPRLKTVVDPYGRHLDFSYYPGRDSLINRVTCITGGISRSISIDFKNNFEDLALYINANNKVTLYDYFVDNNRKNILKEITMPLGNKLYCDFDLNRKFKRSSTRPMTLSTDFDLQVNVNESYAAGSPTYITSVTTMRPTTNSSQSHVTSSTFNQYNLTKTSSSPSHNVIIDYADLQNPALWTTFTNNLTGIVQTRVFDITNSSARGNLKVSNISRNGQSLTSSWEYTPNYNDINKYTDVAGVTTTYTYLNGFLNSISRGQQEIMITPHSSNNGCIASIESGGVKVLYDYNVYFNRISSSIFNTNISFSSIYDDASRQTQNTSANGRIDKVTLYDGMDIIIDGVQDFGNLNLVYHNTINNNGNLNASTLEGQTTNWGFDVLTDELISETFGGLSNQWAYHINGKLQWYKNKNGHQFNQNYFPDNSSFNGAIENDGYVSYTYNANSKSLETITKDGKAITIGVGTDNLLRPTVCTYDGKTISHQLNNYGSITQTNLPNGWIITSTRNANNAIEETRLNGVLLHKRNYDPLTGRQTSEVFGNGNSLFTKQFAYQQHTARITAIDYILANGATRYYEHYTGIDNAGNHTSIEKMNLPLLPPMPVAGIHSLIPDATNRLSNDNGVSVINNNNGVQIGGIVVVTNVDEKDNILSASINGFNLTAEVDGLENVRRINNTKYVVDVLDNNKVLMETDLAGTPLWVNVWSGSEIVCRINVLVGIKFFPIVTYNGSTRMWLDENGTITHQYNYIDAFGTIANKQEAFEMPYQYHGVYGVQTIAPNLLRMGARYYIPSQRRFISTDPISGANNYAFAGQNPEMNVDVTGEFVELIKDGLMATSKVSPQVKLLNEYSNLFVHALDEDIKSIEIDIVSFNLTLLEIGEIIPSAISFIVTEPLIAFVKGPDQTLTMKLVDFGAKNIGEPFIDYLTDVNGRSKSKNVLSEYLIKSSIKKSNSNQAGHTIPAPVFDMNSLIYQSKPKPLTGNLTQFGYQFSPFYNPYLKK